MKYAHGHCIITKVLINTENCYTIRYFKINSLFLKDGTSFEDLDKKMLKLCDKLRTQMGIAGVKITVNI